MAEKHLFLVSTPLHLMVAIAIVDTLEIVDAHIIFIDQVQGRENPYYETLKSWASNPFWTVNVFYRPRRKLIEKWRSRRATFRELSTILSRMKPSHIYTGNDRRVEFQYCMHIATELGCQPKGYYMDEGTFTYVGRKASRTFSDRILDNFVKKLVYGSWWKHPETVGASEWVDAVYVSYPDIVHPLLKEKRSIPLTLKFWQSDALVQFCSLLVDRIGRPKNLADFDMLITLPHESIISSNPAYREEISRIIQSQLSQGFRVGVKYHPRDTNADMLKLGDIEGIELLSRELPFEALLPMIKPGATILGDFSTTLISTRLLRPDLKARAIDHGNNKNAADFIDLYQKIGIDIIKNDH